jgi:hypothetical protein
VARPREAGFGGELCGAGKSLGQTISEVAGYFDDAAPMVGQVAPGMRRYLPR